MFESAETATTCRISTPHGIIGCDAVMEVAAAAASAAEAPVTSGMLMPTSSMNRNEMPVAARRSVGVSISLCFISMPLKNSWIYRKIQVLAIFDDLDTILLMIPLQILMIGRSMNRNEMPVAARRSVGVSISLCFISMPITKAGSRWSAP